MILFLFFAPCLFFVCEAIYFVMMQKRAFFLLRILFELASFFLFPAIFFDIQFEGYYKLSGFIILYTTIVLSLLCTISYFVSVYRIKIFNPVTEGILNIFLIVGIILNFAIALYVSSEMDYFLAIIGNLPVILALGMALLRNLHLDTANE